MSQVILATPNNFNEVVIEASKTKTVVVDFFADWCGPCKMIMPQFEEAAETNQDVIFVKVNVDDSKELAQKYEVSSIPAFISFKDGEAYKGTKGASSIEDILEKVL